MRLVSNLLRAALSHCGYTLTKTQYQRFGIDPLVDILRLTELSGGTVNTCFDVGANIGQTAQAMMAAFPNSKIHCFEPVEDTFVQLKNNLSHLSNINLHHIALSDQDGATTINVFPSSSLVSSLEDSAIFTIDQQNSAKKQTCDRSRLDNFVINSKIEFIDILKVDTEGHDLSVLRGAENFLKMGKVKFVITEFNVLFSMADTACGSLASTGQFLAECGLDFVCAYFDDIHVSENRTFVVANALFMRN